jgi:hypothetical protein
MIAKPGLCNKAPRRKYSVAHRFCDWLFALGFLLLCTTGFVGPAYAQPVGINPAEIDSPPDEDSVLGRPRPEYAAQGLPLGSFRLFPAFGLSAAFDDNVFRTQSNDKSDYFFDFAPEMILRSQWSRHSLNLSASADHYQYAKYSSETRTDWDVAATGRLDIATGTGLSAQLQHVSTAELRSSPDQVDAAEPTPYQRSLARLAFAYNPYRIGVRFTADYVRTDFDSTKTLQGTLHNNDDRNRDDYSAALTALYEFSPGYAVFVRPGYEKRVYDLQVSKVRNIQGYNVDAGVDLLLSRLISGEVYAGYLRQDLQGPAFEDLSGIDYGATLRWYPSQLITVHLNASRAPAATTLVGASLSDSKNVELGVDYEFRRNVILQASIQYIDTAFTGIARQDRDLDTQIGAQYLLNPNLTANARFTHRSRDSTVSGHSYGDNEVLVSLNVHL